MHALVKQTLDLASGLASSYWDTEMMNKTRTRTLRKHIAPADSFKRPFSRLA